MLLILSFIQLWTSVAHGLALEGYGSETHSIGGIGVLGRTSPGASFHNPALLGLDPSQGSFFYTLSLQKNVFKPIHGVIVQNAYTGGEEMRGSVDVNGRYKLVHTLAGRVVLMPRWRQLTLGVLAQIPDTGLTQIDTGGFLQPRYIRLSEEGHIPELHTGMSLILWEGLSVGLGSSFGAKVKGFTDLHMTTTPGSSSHARMKARLAPSFSPYLGLHYKNDLLVPMQTGLVARTPHQVSTLLTVEASARVASQSMYIPMEVEHLMQYRPWSFEWAFGIQPIPGLELFTQLEYQLYSQAPQRFMTIRRIEGKESSLNISTPRTHEIIYQDILVSRFGVEWTPRKEHQIRGGFAYRPSTLPQLPTLLDNALDPPAFLFTTGWTGRFGRPLPFPLKVSLGGGLEWLQTQRITKASSSSIGSPGYEAGGLRWFTSLTLEIPFLLELSTKHE